MADDDRYRWLDDEAAERLLHGSAVNARSTRPGGRQGSSHVNVEAAPTSAYERPADATPFWARGGGNAGNTGASVPEQRTREDLAEDRLASLLDSLVAEQTATLHALGAARTGVPAGDAHGELPGEAAAMEAFRAAHPGTSAAHNGTIDISAGPTEAGTVVGRRAVRESETRSRRRRPGGARRASLVGRPLRAGFAMAVAGCALGGAAVAAGAGVLPTPFGGGGAPAASVSPMVSPGDERDEASSGGHGSPYDGNDPRRGTREGESPSDSRSGEDLAGKERGRGGDHSKDPKGNEDWLHGDGKDLSEADKKAMARALCEAYEDDQLSLQYRLRLEEAAGGPEGVKKFCHKHGGDRGEQTDAGAGNNGGIGAPGDPGEVGGSSSGSDGGDDGDSGGGDSGGESGGESGGDESGGAGGSRPDSGGQSDGSDGDSVGTASSSPDADEVTPTPDASVSASAGS
jgi:hypothetical protein